MKAMTAKSYSLLAAAIFTVVAVVQLSRTVMGFQLMVGSHAIPVWASGLAFLVAGVLAWLGFSAARD